MANLDSTILSIRRQLKGCVARLAGHYCPSQNCGCSSVGRAPPCQGGRREFEPRHPLCISLVHSCTRLTGAFALGTTKDAYISRSSHPIRDFQSESFPGNLSIWFSEP